MGILGVWEGERFGTKDHPTSRSKARTREVPRAQTCKKSPGQAPESEHFLKCHILVPHWPCQGLSRGAGPGSRRRVPAGLRRASEGGFWAHTGRLNYWLKLCGCAVREVQGTLPPCFSWNMLGIHRGSAAFPTVRPAQKAPSPSPSSSLCSDLS